MFHYRWKWNTTHLNIYWFIRDVFTGIKNIIKWSPVIFYDRDWDYAYLLAIMEFKMVNMSKHFKKYGVCTSWERQYQQLLVASKLCKRMRDQNYGVLPFGTRKNKVEYESEQMKKDLEYLTKLMNKHLFGWWD